MTPQRCPDEGLLRRLLGDQLSGAETEAAEAHVEACADCQRTLEWLTAGAEQRDGLRDETVPTFLRRLEDSPTGAWLVGHPDEPGTHPPWPAKDGPATGAPSLVAGYEILGELGRGGMGVVYKARQVGLNRVVALKMILHGAHASGEERARFRVEAEAIARLQHPNIVQVYEIGEQDGMPFFSLEFCAGGSLAERLGDGPLPPREAAGVIVTLARAAHAAHQRGVIHRDLKPANILFQAGTERRAAGDDTPANDLVALPGLKITDFGLAKRLDEAGQTRTGTILGTPSYMAPEQAAGPGAAVTTLADVYALGAILYECLTGRPPFLAGTALDTVLEVLERPPAPPSTLRPGLDRGLELICLRCLEKDPSRRYGSADALAEELQRWLAGEPLSVRPPSLALLVRSWLRQNFGSAGWTVIIGLAGGLLLGLLAWVVLLQPSLALHSRGSAVLPSQSRSWLAVPWNPAAWLLHLAILLCLAVAVSLGLWTALLVRPRSRQADLAAGGATGLMAGVVFFTMSFGWCAVALSGAASYHDQWLLAQAAFSERPGAGSRRLLERYPDLQRVPAEQRGAAVYSALMAEQLTAIPLGLWTGMFLSLAFGVGAGVFGTAAAGPLVRQGGRRWVLLLRYLELAIPGTVVLAQLLSLAILALFATTRMNLPLWYLPLVLAASALAIAAALRGWPWPVRLAFFLFLTGVLLASGFLELGDRKRRGQSNQPPVGRDLGLRADHRGRSSRADAEAKSRVRQMLRGEVARLEGE